ncbi:MAG: YqhR family membrane protein, partial [Bacillus amyloliquefaciens]
MTSEKHSEQEEEKKQDDDQQPVSFTGRICGIGFAGGVFWSLIGYLGYVFHFSEISPNMILQPFMIGE